MLVIRSFCAVQTAPCITHIMIRIFLVHGWCTDIAKRRNFVSQLATVHLAQPLELASRCHQERHVSSSFPVYRVTG